MLRRPKLFYAACLLALLFAPPVGAEIYKWVDEKGVVNYGSNPPSGRAVKELPKDAATGISVVPAPPLPPPTATNPMDERVERLEKALADEKAARQDQERRDEERRKAAIAQCEASRGVDCDQDPYQYDSSYATGGRVVARPLPFRPPHHHPKPPPPGKPRPPARPEWDTPATIPLYRPPMK